MYLLSQLQYGQRGLQRTGKIDIDISYHVHYAALGVCDAKLTFVVLVAAGVVTCVGSPLPASDFPSLVATSAFEASTDAVDVATIALHCTALHCIASNSNHLQNRDLESFLNSLTTLVS
jgi:hypothetical protein